MDFPDIINKVTLWNNFIISKLDIELPHFIQYYLVFNLEIILILLTIEYLLQGVWSLSYNIYSKLKYKLVKKPETLVTAFNVYYFIEKMTTLLRPYKIYIYRGYESNQDKLYNKIAKMVFFGAVCEFILYIFKPSVKNFLVLGLSLLTYSGFGVNKLLSSSQNLFNNPGDIVEGLKSISFVITLTVIAIAWYYTGIKGQLDRAVAQANKNLLVKSLDVHRKIIDILSELIYTGADNIQYAISNRNSIMRCYLKKISPLIDKVKDVKVEWSIKQTIWTRFDKQDFTFYEIKEIDELVETFNKAVENEIYKPLFWLPWTKYDMRGILKLADETGFSSLEKRLNLKLFTPSGFNSIFDRKIKTYIFEGCQKKLPPEDELEYINEQVLKEFHEFEVRFDRQITDGIEYLIRLNYYFNSTYRLLHPNSNRLGRSIRFITGKE